MGLTKRSAPQLCGLQIERAAAAVVVGGGGGAAGVRGVKLIDLHRSN